MKAPTGRYVPADTHEDECTRQTGKCESCGRPTCWRCGRCKDKIPATAPGTFSHYCPALRCRVIKWLRGGR